MHTEQIEAAAANAFGHAIHVALSSLLTIEVPEAVDRVEGDVVLPLGLKSRHIGNSCSVANAVSRQPIVTELHRFGIQIDA